PPVEDVTVDRPLQPVQALSLGVQLATEFVDAIDHLAQDAAVATTLGAARPRYHCGHHSVADVETGGDSLRRALDRVFLEGQRRLRVIQVPATLGRGEAVRPSGPQRIGDVGVAGPPAPVTKCAAIDL